MRAHIKESAPILGFLLVVAFFGLLLTVFAKRAISQEKITLESHPTQVP